MRDRLRYYWLWATNRTRWALLPVRWAIRLVYEYVRAFVLNVRYGALLTYGGYPWVFLVWMVSLIPSLLLCRACDPFLEHGETRPFGTAGCVLFLSFEAYRHMLIGYLYGTRERDRGEILAHARSGTAQFRSTLFVYGDRYRETRRGPRPWVVLRQSRVPTTQPPPYRVFLGVDALTRWDRSAENPGRTEHTVRIPDGL